MHESHTVYARRTERAREMMKKGVRPSVSEAEDIAAMLVSNTAAPFIH